MNLLRRRFKIAHLIAEEFAGVITKENQARLEQWRVENPAHTKEYDEIRIYIMTENERREKEKQTVKNEWRKFERIHFRKYVIWRRIGRYAAIMVMPLLVCGYFVSSEWKSSEVTIIDNVEIVPGTGRAQLIMVDGRFLKLEQKEDMKLDLPGVKVVATGKKIVYRAIEEETSTPKEEEYNTLVVPRGGEYMVELSDGTKVWLNSDSELRFPVTFVGDRRNVEIEGEAYFDVAPDKEHPFIVKTSHTSIRVTGTSFNVRAYADEDTESTTLISGTVRINSGNEEFELVPNQHYTYNKNTGTNTVANVNTDLYTSWESGSFIFLNVPLENVMSYLSKWYGFQYSFEDEAAKQVRIGAYLNRYANMNPIIDMITELNLVNIKQREGILHISYKQ